VAKLARDLKTKLGFTGFDSLPTSGEFQLASCDQINFYLSFFFFFLFFKNLDQKVKNLLLTFYETKL